MTERWGKCRPCGGSGKRRDPVLLRTIDCWICNGEGFSGSAEEFAAREREADERVNPLPDEWKKL